MREHELVPQGADWVCKHCGRDALAITAGELGHFPFPCVSWTDIPKVKYIRPQKARNLFGFKRK